MAESKRVKLKKLGPDILADALLELAIRNEDAKRVIERLIATEEDVIKSFKAGIAKIKRGRKVYDWRQSDRFAFELESLLLDIEHNVKDPAVGLVLVADFFRIAGRVFERTDDSNGSIGGIYAIPATDLFTKYARECSDKSIVTNLLIDLIGSDEYGTSDQLLVEVGSYLDDKEMRMLVERFQTLEKGDGDRLQEQRWSHCVEELAAHLKDPKLFEQSRLAIRDGDPSIFDCIDIAKVYLDAGDFKTARDWLEKISNDESHSADVRDALLVRIYGELGQKDKLEPVVWRIFRRHRSAETLETLLKSLKADRKAVVVKEAEAIFADAYFSYTDAAFLIDCDESLKAEEYVLSRQDEIRGGFYDATLNLAKRLESTGRLIGAVIAYRALLDSILEKGKTKGYYYGVRYLKKLDKMNTLITDWRGVESHKNYVFGLRRDHGRKTSFWSKYEG